MFKAVKQLQRLFLAGLGEGCFLHSSLGAQRTYGCGGRCRHALGGVLSLLVMCFPCLRSSLGGTSIPVSEAQAVVLFRCPSLLRPPSRGSAGRGGNREGTLHTVSVRRSFPL